MGQEPAGSVGHDDQGLYVTPTAAPHPLVAPLAPLLGSWAGTGTGVLPDGREFTWTERLTIATMGMPTIAIQQRTRRPDGSPFHAEDAWLRIPPELQDDPPGAVRPAELAVASPTGVLEACSGTAQATDDGCVVDVTSTTVTGTTAAAVVHATRRRYHVEADRLTVEFWMATPTFPELFHHLTAVLDRTS